MRSGKRYLLAALLGLVLASPAWAQDPPANAAPPPAGAFSNTTPPPPCPNFCPHGETARNILYPFSEGTDAYHPVGNAFCDPNQIEGLPLPRQDQEPTYYFGIGAIAMRRTTLSRETVAELAPPLSYTAPNPVDLQAVAMPFLLGITAEIGINFGPGALELSGFYLFPGASVYSQQGNVLNIPGFTFIPGVLPEFNSRANFANFPTPAGFNPGLWAANTNGSYLTTLSYSMALGDVELNYRLAVFERAFLLFGLRYVDTDERINIGTLDSFGSTSYVDATRSRIIGPQLGFEYELPLLGNPTTGAAVSLDFKGKVAGGPNFYYVVHTLQQSAGPNGPGSDINGVQLSGVVDVGLFANIYFTENIKLHAGYDVMWILNVPEAQQQINFNTTVGTGTGDYHGLYFFQGPIVELVFQF